MSFVQIERNTWINPEHVVSVKSTSTTFGGVATSTDVVIEMLGGSTIRMMPSLTLDEVMARVVGRSRAFDSVPQRYVPPTEPAPNSSWVKETKKG
jgi:hypothetical protein